MSPEATIDILLSVWERLQILIALHRTGCTDLHRTISETLQLLPLKDASVQSEIKPVKE